MKNVLAFPFWAVGLLVSLGGCVYMHSDPELAAPYNTGGATSGVGFIIILIGGGIFWLGNLIAGKKDD